MRVLQLGVGSVGEVTARIVAGEPEVSRVVLADIDERRTAAVAEKLPAGKAETLALDVTDVFARALYDQLDTVESLTVFDGDNCSADGYELAPGFSPTTKSRSSCPCTSRRGSWRRSA